MSKPAPPFYRVKVKVFCPYSCTKYNTNGRMVELTIETENKYLDVVSGFVVYCELYHTCKSVLEPDVCKIRDLMSVRKNGL